MTELPLLIVHSSVEVHASLRRAFAPRDVRTVHDALSAGAELSSTAFQAIILEHPLMGMAAPDLAAWLRGMGATCPFLILAAGLDQEALQALADDVGEGCLVLGSTETFHVVPTLERLCAPVSDEASTAPAADGGAGPEPLVVLGEGEAAPEAFTIVGDEAPDVEAILARLGGATLALKVDEASCQRWVPLDLPPFLIGLLDGTHSARTIVNATGDEGPAMAALLGRLKEEDCLEMGASFAPAGEQVPAAEEIGVEARVEEEELEVIVVGGSGESDARAALPPSPWTPPEPARPPDEQGRLEDMPVPELLLSLRRRAEEGQLVIKAQPHSFLLEVKQGSPVKASGGPPETTIGSVLLRLGYLDDRSHARLVAEHESARLAGSKAAIGEMGVKMGLVTGPQVSAALAAVVEEKIVALLSVESGAYRFYRGASTQSTLASDMPPVEAIIGKGLKELGGRRVALIEAFLGKHAGRGVKATPRALEILPLFHFGARVQRFLTILDGRAIGKALEGTPIPRAEAETVLYLLWAAGAIEMVEPRTVVQLRTTTPLGIPPPDVIRSSMHVAKPSTKSEPIRSAPQPRVEPLPSKPPRLPTEPVPAATPPPEPLPTRTAPPPSAPAPPPAARRQAAPVSAAALARARELCTGAQEAVTKKDFQTALALLSEAASLAPDDVEVLATRGFTIFRSQPGSERARKDGADLLKRALAIDAGNVAALVALAKIHRMDGDLGEAHHLLERALKVDGANEAAKQDMASLKKMMTMKKEPGEEAEEQGDSSARFFGFLFGKKKP